MVIKSHSQYFLHSPAIMLTYRIFQKGYCRSSVMRGIAQKKNAYFLNLEIILLIKFDSHVKAIIDRM